MRFEFIQITHISVQHFKSFSRVKSTLDEKVRFIKWNELKVTQVELLSVFIFKSEHIPKVIFSHKCTKLKGHFHP